jgi:uncharacterized protein (DUF2267 family)
MKHDELVAAVAERAAVSRRYADEIILATLTALGERISADETKDLLAQLPKKYRQTINAVSNPTAMGIDEFVARVAELEGERAPSLDEARSHVAAVFATLTEAVNTGEMRDVLDQLGDDFAPLLETAVEERVGETLVAHAGSGPGAPVGIDVGREGRSVVGAVAGAVAGAVTRGVTSVVHDARRRVFDLVVLAVDGLEAITDHLDDAAEALQERVHDKVAAGH